MTITPNTSQRDLVRLRRQNDGIHVRLLWGETDNRVAVAVADTRTGDAFVVEVSNGDSALDVFHHPYAYAAWHRVDTRARLRVAL